MQLGLSEDIKWILNPDAVKLVQTEESDSMDADLNNEAHKELQLMHVGPSKVEGTSTLKKNVECPENAKRV